MVSRVNVVLWAGLLVTFVGSVCCKPCLDSLWCEMMCDDDDDPSTATTTEDILDRFLCSGCPPRRRRPATPRPGPPFSILLGGSTMNMSMAPQNGSWVLSYAPMGGVPPPAAAAAPRPPVAAAAVAPVPAAPPVPAPAPAAAVAPAAAAPAPAAAAATATTPAPTTKKP